MHCAWRLRSWQFARTARRQSRCLRPAFCRRSVPPASHRRSALAFCRTYRRPVRTMMVSICPLRWDQPVIAAAPGSVIRVQRKGPGGLEMLVQHDGFVGIYSHFGMISPAFAEGKRTVAAGERLGVVGRTGVSLGRASVFRNGAGRQTGRSDALSRPATLWRRRGDDNGQTRYRRRNLWWSEGTISSRFPTDSTSDWQQH